MGNAALIYFMSTINGKMLANEFLHFNSENTKIYDYFKIKKEESGSIRFVLFTNPIKAETENMQIFRFISLSMPCL